MPRASCDVAGDGGLGALACVGGGDRVPGANSTIGRALRKIDHSLSTVRAQNAAYRAQLGAERRRRIDQEMRSKLIDLRDQQGIKLDLEHEAKHLNSLPTDKDRKQHLARIEKNYAKSVNGPSIVRASQSARAIGRRSAPSDPDVFSADTLGKITTLSSRIMQKKGITDPDIAFSMAAEELGYAAALGIKAPDVTT